MKRATLFLLVFAGLLSLSAMPVMAMSDNAALVVHDDWTCVWHTGSLEARGSAKYVETKNGKWTMICQGTYFSYSDTLPSRAIQLSSSSRDSHGTCWTPYGTTDDWHMTFTPNGKSSFVCHGDLTP